MVVERRLWGQLFCETGPASLTCKRPVFRTWKHGRSRWGKQQAQFIFVLEYYLYRGPLYGRAL